jgi:putative transposase
MEQQRVGKTYKYRLDPTPEQAQALGVTLWRCRTLYHVALEQRKLWWERGQGVGASYYQQTAELPGLKAAYPEFGAVHAHILQDVILRLDRTFQAFFRRMKAGETPGYPRFHGRGRYTSFTFPEYDNGAALDGSVLSLSKIGRIRIWLHRPLEGTPKTVTISREADGYSVCFSCAEVSTQPLPPTGQETGIDLGIEAFATLSDGTRIFSPGWYRKAERALKTAQRRVSRRKRGSHRRRKAVTLLAKAHQTVRRQRQDFHHKAALTLVRANDVIYHEDLQVRNMAQNSRLAKSIHDVSWAAFLLMLSHKAVCAGRSVVAVNPAFTSQRCSGCGVLVQKGLSVHWHSCPDCGIGITTQPRTENGPGRPVGEAWRRLCRRTEKPLRLRMGSMSLRQRRAAGVRYGDCFKEGSYV